jgi:hypothetical protein
MTIAEFDNKWKTHLETGHYGLAITHPDVILYLDQKFTEIKTTNPNFQYSQIKLKFDQARVYMEPYTINTREIEQEINKILKPLN